MRIHEILSDLPQIKQLRLALKEVAATQANKFTLGTTLSLDGRPADTVTKAAADEVVSAMLSGTNLKAAIRQALKARLDALELKYSGITIEED